MIIAYINGNLKEVPSIEGFLSAHDYAEEVTFDYLVERWQDYKTDCLIAVSDDVSEYEEFILNAITYGTIQEKINERRENFPEYEGAVEYHQELLSEGIRANTPARTIANLIADEWFCLLNDC